MHARVPPQYDRCGDSRLMPWYAADTTGRLPARPVFAKSEIEKLCTATVRQFLEDLYGRARFPGRHDVDWMEWQANYAAGALLMPYHAVADLLNEINHSADKTAEDHDRVLIAGVTGHFIVSWSAATVRLRQLGVLRRPRRLPRR